MDRAARLDLIRDLREQTRQIERSALVPVGSDEEPGRTLRDLLLGRGLTAGTLVEWQGRGEGSGAVSLALSVAGQILRDGGACVVIDPTREFYPPGAAYLGVMPEQTIVVRAPDFRSGLWAWEQSLRSGAVSVTLGRVEGLNERHFHRLQLAAEAGGRLGFFLRGPRDRAGPSRAAVRVLVSGRPSRGPLYPLARRLRVELLHCRGGAAGEVVEVELDHETNHVRLLPELAHPAPARVALYA
jgi:recombination protein RecA